MTTFRAIPCLLQINESLKSLNLSWNGLAFVGALALARHLKKNDTLEELDIRFVDPKLFVFNYTT